MRGANTVIGLAGLFLFTSNAHMNAQSVQAQSPDASDWQATAGGNKSFDVASVKPAKDGRGFGRIKMAELKPRSMRSSERPLKR